MEQVIGQQTADEGQEDSPLDNLIRQLQHQQDERLNSGNPAAGQDAATRRIRSVLFYHLEKMRTYLISFLHLGAAGFSRLWFPSASALTLALFISLLLL